MKTSRSHLAARLCAIAGAVTAASIASLAIAATAVAEVGAPRGTVQQVAADALFLQYAPPPATPGVVCMVDSGVDVNADTSPALVGSYALQSGTDTADELARVNPPAPGGHPNGHGTYMAELMAAPQNGWGMVGIAPTSVRVYNVKALGSGQSTFPFAWYANAITYCQKLTSSTPTLSVVNLSLGNGQAPASGDVTSVQTAVDNARGHGLNVVAAAGNSGGAVEYPAAFNDVLAVGAADANPASTGVFCSFSDRGAGLGVLAPGCNTKTGGVDVAFADDGSPALVNGTSGASALVSAVIASMRAYASSVGVDQAQQCITAGEVNGGNLDVAAAFKACGLGNIVSAGQSAYAAANPPAAAPPSTPSGGGSGVITGGGDPGSTQTPSPPSGRTAHPPLPRPRVSVRYARGLLTVTASNLPRGARMSVHVKLRSRRGLTMVASRRSTRSSVRLSVRRWSLVSVAFSDPTGRARPSAATAVARWASNLRGQ